MILENSKSAPTFNLNLLCPLFGFLVLFSQSTFRFASSNVVLLLTSSKLSEAVEGCIIIECCAIIEGCAIIHNLRHDQLLCHHLFY